MGPNQELLIGWCLPGGQAVTGNELDSLLVELRPAQSLGQFARQDHLSIARLDGAHEV